MKNVSIFYDHLEYFTAIWYNLWPFGTVCGHLVYISKFWYICLDQEKSGNNVTVADVFEKVLTRFPKFRATTARTFRTMY
jgi:hypothetical protein